MQRGCVLLGLLGAAVFALAVWLMTPGAPGSAAARDAIGRFVMEGQLEVLVYALVGGAVLAAHGIGIRRGQAARDAWERFALDHRLTYERGSWLETPFGRVHGAVNGIAVELTSRTHHTGGGISSRPSKVRTYHVLSLTPPGLPPGLSAHARRERWPTTAAAAGAPAELVVSGVDPDVAGAWLTEPRRRALEELVAGDDFVVADGRLAWQRDEAPRSTEALDRALERLLAIAARLA